MRLSATYSDCLIVRVNPAILASAPRGVEGAPRRRVRQILGGVPVIEVAVCAYCQTEMDRATAPRCPDCDAVHHQDCWQDNGGCAVLGCVAGPDGPPLEQTASAAQAGAPTG